MLYSLCLPIPEDTYTYNLNVLTKKASPYKGRTGKKRPNANDGIIDYVFDPDADLAMEKAKLYASDDDETDPGELKNIPKEKNFNKPVRHQNVSQSKLTSIAENPNKAQLLVDSPEEQNLEVNEADHIAQIDEVLPGDEVNCHYVEIPAGSNVSDTVSSRGYSEGSDLCDVPDIFKIQKAPPIVPQFWYNNSAYRCLQPGKWLCADLINDMIVGCLRAFPMQADVVYLNSFHFTNSQKVLFKRIIHDAVHLQALPHPVMLIEVHIGNHYVLAAVNFKLREITVIDSMPGQNHTELFQAIFYFLSASFITQGLRVPLKWRYILKSTTQVQADSSSCGVYVVYHAHCILRKKSFSPYSERLPNGRRWILNCLRTIDTPVKVPRVYPLRRIPPKDAEPLAKVLQGLEMQNIYKVFAILCML